MAAPRISVVIPTRNRAESLRRCLREVLSQVDFATDEVIVADDGSTDSTSSLKNEFDAVRWVRLEGQGTCAARNRAVAMATGDLVLFIDDDIVCSPGMVGRHRHFHRLHPDPTDALVGHVTWHKESKITKHMLWLEDGGPLFAFNTISNPDAVDPRHFCTANSSVKRELLDRVEGPFEERIPRFTDVELAMRLSKQGMRLHYDPEAIGWHLRVDTPATTDKRMFEVGRASVILDRIHPGVAPEAGGLTFWRGARVLVARALTPVAPLLPTAAADRIWSARAAWAYASGRASEGGLK